MAVQTGVPALEFIAQRPNRKSRSEALLRQLVNTSYPHSTLANLAIAFYRQAGAIDQAELDASAIQLRDLERGFDLFHFIRTVSLRRHGESLTIALKAIKVESGMCDVRDIPDNHEVLAEAQLHCDGALSDVSGIAHTLLNLYYRSHMRGRAWGDDVLKSKWMMRYQMTGAHPDQPDDAATRPPDTPIDYHDTLQTVMTSLTCAQFHLELNQSTFLLLDQCRRLWCLDHPAR